MTVWNVLTTLAKPVLDLVDTVQNNETERLEIKSKMLEMQQQLAMQMLDYETRLLEAKTKVIAAEAEGQSFLQRAWRPITMLTFLGLVVADTFGLTTFRLAEEAWTLLQVGLGGYVAGRSAEKVIPKITEAIKHAKR